MDIFIKSKSMKKFFLMIAVASLAMVASAQEPAKGFYGNKFTDNWYIGAEAGMASKTTHQAVLKNANPNFGIRLGKWFTPAFGFALEGQTFFGNKVKGDDYTDASGIKALQLNLLSQWNLSNIFGGYPGEPRNFEVIGNVGIGWGHNSGNRPANTVGLGTIRNTLNNKLAFDFAWNFGDKKQWQFYVEPSITWAIAGAKSDYVNDKGQVVYDKDGNGRTLVNWDINYSNIQLNVGFNYFFRTSNGTHHFVNVVECDQNEIDALNATINDLRNKSNDDAAKMAQLLDEIANLKKALKDCEEAPKVVQKEVEIEPNLPAVFYQVNKSIITPAQAQNVAIAAQVMKNHPELKLQIKGYASPEGPHDNNNNLSVRRAKAVKDLLVKKYGISPSRIKTEGCGETDKLFEIYEFNRVAMLYIEK